MVISGSFVHILKSTALYIFKRVIKYISRKEEERYGKGQIIKVDNQQCSPELAL